MGTPDEEEAMLKKKLEGVEDLDERREIRRQIRELRNKKFDEEIKKISSGNYDASSSSLLTNGFSTSSSSSSKKTESSTSDEYGLSKYNDLDALQELLNETPYTETDKRRKIRGRIREIKNGNIDSPAVESQVSNNTANGSVSLSSRRSSRDTSTTGKAVSTVNENEEKQDFEPRKSSVTEFRSRPRREKTIEPIREPSPEPIREPSPEPIREPSPEPIRKPSPEPIREPSPEPIREPSPEPIREPSPEPIRELSPETIKEPSREPVRDARQSLDRKTRDESRTESLAASQCENEERELSSGNCSESDQYTSDSMRDTSGSETKIAFSKPSAKSQSNSAVEEVLAEAEPGFSTGKDFKEKLKKSQHTPQISPQVSRSGEQVDFRTNLKKKSDKPAVNLERKSVAPEQKDFRTALVNKVATPKKDKDRDSSGPDQKDFRTVLQRKVQTRTLADKNIVAEQKDFRTMLGKSPASQKPASPVPKNEPKSVDQLDFRTVLKKADSVPPSKKASFKVSSPSTSPLPKPAALEKARRESLKRRDSDVTREQVSASIDLDDVAEPSSEGDTDHTDSTSKVSLEDTENAQVEHATSSTVDKGKKQPPPTAPKKKALVSTPVKKAVPPVNQNRSDSETSGNELESLNHSGMHSSKRQQESSDGDDEDEEVEGFNRNRHNARAKTTQKFSHRRDSGNVSAKLRQDKREEKMKERSEESEDNVDNGSRRAQRRRARRVEAESKEENNKAQPIATEKHATQETAVEEQKEEKSSAANMSSLKTTQSKMMGRIKFGSDDEGEVKVLNTAVSKLAMSEKNEVVSSDGEVTTIKRERSSKRGKKEAETIEVSSDLLAEIAKPKEPEKRRIPLNLEKKPAERKTPERKTPLTGEAAKRDAERRKEREKWEEEQKKRQEEREERARQRERDREEREKKRIAERKLREQEAAEKRRASRLAAAKKTGTSRTDRNKFKEQLEANAPANGEIKSNVNKQNSNVTKLLSWAQKRTAGYEGVNVENFSDSWADGLAFAAMMHSFFPADVPISELNKDTKRRNFEIAFNLASEEGVPDLLDIEDMCRMHSPDPKSIMTYLSALYQTLMMGD